MEWLDTFGYLFDSSFSYEVHYSKRKQKGDDGSGKANKGEKQRDNLWFTNSVLRYYDLRHIHATSTADPLVLYRVGDIYTRDDSADCGRGPTPFQETGNAYDERFF